MLGIYLISLLLVVGGASALDFTREEPYKQHEESYVFELFAAAGSIFLFINMLPEEKQRGVFFLLAFVPVVLAHIIGFAIRVVHENLIWKDINKHSH